MRENHDNTTEKEGSIKYLFISSFMRYVGKGGTLLRPISPDFSRHTDASKSTQTHTKVSLPLPIWFFLSDVPPSLVDSSSFPSFCFFLQNLSQIGNRCLPPFLPLLLLFPIHQWLGHKTSPPPSSSLLPLSPPPTLPHTCFRQKNFLLFYFSIFPVQYTGGEGKTVAGETYPSCDFLSWNIATKKSVEGDVCPILSDGAYGGGRDGCQMLRRAFICLDIWTTRTGLDFFGKHLGSN